MSMVEYEKNDAIAKIRLNRPEAANALTDEMLIELINAMRKAIDDREIRVVIFCSNGKNFCAGEDLNWAKEQFQSINAGEINPWDFAESTLDRFQELTRLQTNDLKVCIAAVHGWAIGAGWEIALACDMVIAAENAKFSFREVKIGTPITGAGTYFLPQVVGRSIAREWMLTGDTVTAEDGYRCGMVNRVVPVGQEEKKAEEIAQRIVANKRAVVVAHKRLANAAPEVSLSVALQYEKAASCQADLAGSVTTGIEEFLESKKE